MIYLAYTLVALGLLGLVRLFANLGRGRLWIVLLAVLMFPSCAMRIGAGVQSGTEYSTHVHSLPSGRQMPHTESEKVTRATGRVEVSTGTPIEVGLWA